MDALTALQFGLAPALATALLHALWQDALLGIGAWAALAAMRRSTASLRHAVAMAFLVAMLLAPLSTFVHFWRAPTLGVDAGRLVAIALPAVDGTGGLHVRQSSPVALVLALLWIAGATLMLLRHIGGWRLVSALERWPSEPLPAHWQQRVEQMRAAMGISRDVAVRLSKDVVGPFTARLFRPVIWLPLSLLMQMPREQVEALLAHELAHVARMDWLWNGLQCLVESLLFFHPAAWWLGRRIRTEREHACDDIAVAACGDAIALAEALAQLERRRLDAPHLVLAAHGGALMQRITRLVSGPPSRGRWGTRAGLAVLVTAGVVLAVQAGVSGNWRPALHLRATTDGPLRAGDMREITAHGIEGDRYYRAEVDATGKLTEVYKRDGEVRPVDAGVRRWVAEVTRLGVPPVPPTPPAPPPPPPLPPGVAPAVASSAPPAPPAMPTPPAGGAPAALPPPAPVAGGVPAIAPPPPPPAPPAIEEHTAYRSLIPVIAAHPAVAARIGLPVVVASGVHGRFEVDGGARPDGGANVRLELRGPKGRGTAHVVADLDDGVWTIERLDFE